MAPIKTQHLPKLVLIVGLIAPGTSFAALIQRSALGQGQYRNAVASGECLECNVHRSPMHNIDPTLPRYGTDLVQESAQRNDSLKPHTSCELDSGLKIVQVDRLPKETKFRTVETSKGDLKISLADGYRVMVAYNNKRDWFVNIKAEKSLPGEYERDKEGVIENLKFAASTTKDLEQPEPVKVSFNGFEGYGTSKQTLTGNLLGMYLLFSDIDQTITTFYFINHNAKRQRYKTIEEWRTIRDEFLNTYTTCINNSRRVVSPN